MRKTASDGSKEGIPAGARGGAAGKFATFQVGFVERLRKVDGFVAENDSATGRRVETFAFAKRKTGGFADRANFSPVGVFATGTMGEVFKKQEAIFIFDFLKLADVDGKAERVLENEDFEFFIGFCQLFQVFCGVVGEDFTTNGFFEVDKDRFELGVFDGFKDGVASESVDSDMVAFFNFIAGEKTFESEGDCRTTGENERNTRGVGIIFFSEGGFESVVVLFSAGGERVASNVLGGIVRG